MINTSFNTTDTTPSITFNYTDAISDTASCALFFDDVSVATNAAVDKDTNTILTASEQSEGSYTVYANCTDESGNINKSGEITVVIDTTGPVVTVTNPIDQTYINESSLDIINGTVNDTLVGADNVTLYI